MVAQPKLRMEEALAAGMLPLLEELGFSKKRKASRTHIRETSDIRMWVDFRHTNAFPRGFTEVTGVYFPAAQALADELLDGEFDTDADALRLPCHCTTSVIYAWETELERTHRARKRESWWYRWRTLVAPRIYEVCPHVNSDRVWQLDDDYEYDPNPHKNDRGRKIDPVELGAFVAEKWRQYCLPWLRRAEEMGPAFYLWDSAQELYNETLADYEQRAGATVNIRHALFYHLAGDFEGRDRNVRLAHDPYKPDELEAKVQTGLARLKAGEDVGEIKWPLKERLQAMRLAETFGVDVCEAGTQEPPARRQ